MLSDGPSFGQYESIDIDALATMGKKSISAANYDREPYEFSSTTMFDKTTAERPCVGGNQATRRAVEINSRAVGEMRDLTPTKPSL